HLHRINKAEDPYCPHCLNTEESVHHFLLECTHYLRQRHTIQNELGHDTSSIPHLLTDTEAIKHLVKYVNDTKCLKNTFGEVPTTRKCKN
ncbi:hypothetical protein CY34DRAFT_101892, partial [Suillus luteus UH-Slu-Lm8-n1]